MGFKKVELCIDSASVVEVLKLRKLHSLTGGTVVKQIWKLLDLDWDIEISHSNREANKTNYHDIGMKFLPSLAMTNLSRGTCGAHEVGSPSA
ncbi:hypothetical protein A2U01_0014039 [Trifolium medium]|uniref:RNase H type-1 domain-containing protein n=1 Tax=Trifolium medium TaxID=97028 RepID=A0A392N015_9FABA|nr:hypothetical protein [Trifolium medium]